MAEARVFQQLARSFGVPIVNHDPAWYGRNVPVKDVHEAIEIVVRDVVALQQCPHVTEQNKVIRPQ
jgi:hypothetical protein